MSAFCTVTFSVSHYNVSFIDIYVFTSYLYDLSTVTFAIFIVTYHMSTVTFLILTYDFSTVAFSILIQRMLVNSYVSRFSMQGMTCQQVMFFISCSSVRFVDIYVFTLFV